MSTFSGTSVEAGALIGEAPRKQAQKAAARQS
jgi:hypothetical protein